MSVIDFMMILPDLCISMFQEFDSSVSDIVEDILKMHDTTKVIRFSFQCRFVMLKKLELVDINFN